MISRKIKKSLFQKKKVLFEPINDRISKIRQKGKFRNTTLITAYAATEESNKDKILDFY